MVPSVDLSADELLERHRATAEPRTCRLLGREWDVLPGVYAPDLTRCAALYAEWLPYPAGGSFCEIGCGTGYIAVTAALRGCARVTATDVNAAAAENARRNAARHGVADVVRTACGDMFAALEPGDRYDVVFWNSSFVDAARERASDLERAFFDPGYAAHEAYLRGARAHLNPGGTLLLGFASIGNAQRLGALAAAHGWRAKLARAVTTDSALGRIQYQLIRFDSSEVS